ncbi:hypothetical protein YA62_009780 [Agrobacterium sp. LC34]|uniref:Uncharacterized protein n=2 Tax=Agrobacterium tumefaciens complex TaxID=1183400 RepID=A0AAE6ELY7_AGRTU|nr:hypothetical protein CFBP6623_18155 [Agrobacterium tumefaciens]QCM02101.1 hypothetical protein CFBP6624_17970 [Agrobacterium tumefaciens]TKT65778.1 hypothetical protein YA62_009780 [Agrobacterium sp. LC34]
MWSKMNNAGSTRFHTVDCREGSMAASTTAILEQDNADEILALGRMVSYLCQRSKSMELGMSTYFLEMALLSLAQDINQHGLPPAGAELNSSGFAPADLH